MDVIAKLLGTVANYAGDPNSTMALLVILSVLSFILIGTIAVIAWIGLRYLMTGSTQPLAKEMANGTITGRHNQREASRRFTDALRVVVDNALDQNVSDEKILEMITEVVENKAKRYPNNKFIRNLKKPENLRELTREFIEDALLIKGIQNESVHQSEGDDK